MNFLRDIKLTKKHFILLGIAVIAFVGWRVVSVLKPPATEKRTVPVVRTMTVGELSEHLKELDQDAPIIVAGYDGNLYNSIGAWDGSIEEVEE